MIFNANSIWNKPIGASPIIKGEFSNSLSQAPKIGINGVTDYLENGIAWALARDNLEEEASWNLE